jgi:hypothetical protein
MPKQLEYRAREGDSIRVTGPAVVRICGIQYDAKGARVRVLVTPDALAETQGHAVESKERQERQEG